MGMGVPDNAVRGHSGIPMLERMKPQASAASAAGNVSRRGRLRGQVGLIGDALRGKARQAMGRIQSGMSISPINMEGFGSTFPGDEAQRQRFNATDRRERMRHRHATRAHRRSAEAFDARTGRGTPRVSRPVPIRAAPPASATPVAIRARPPAAAPVGPVAPASSAGSGPLADVAGKVESPGAGKASGLRGLLKSPNLKRNALIGAGVIAAASVVQSRRSSGTSRGTQSNYRY